MSAQTRDWLIAARKAAGLSQDAVAKAAGISQTYYGAIERGARGGCIRGYVAKRIADVLGVDWWRFYDGKEEN